MACKQHQDLRCVLLSEPRTPAPLVPGVPTKTRLEPRWRSDSLNPILFTFLVQAYSTDGGDSWERPFQMSAYSVWSVQCPC